MVKHLKQIDFTKGVKAAPINYNFNLIDEWLKHLRLNSSGWGVITGFDLSRDKDTFNINVSSGTLVTFSGEELSLPDKVINVGPPDPTRYFEKHTLTATGKIELRFPVYSPSQLKLIRYINNTEGTLPPTTEFRVYDVETQEIIPVASIIKNNVLVEDPEEHTGKRIEVAYQYASSHIDTITYNENYPDLYPKYYFGIFSSSPSLPDKKTFFKEKDIILGYAYWHITEEGVSVEFLKEPTNNQSIYVNKDNDIYLYGKLYPRRQKQFIYFVQPEKPDPNDLWYNMDDNTLYIWRQYQGKDYAWVSLNSHDQADHKEVHLFDSNEKQTFIFPENKPNMIFKPRTSALEVYIDQGYIMEDQFTEMIMLKARNAAGDHIVVADEPRYLEEDILKGVGFKLNYPLNEPTIVQANVRHVVKPASDSGTFQRAAIFVEEKRIVYNEDTYPNHMRDLRIPSYFQYGKGQLEIYLNGIKLHGGSSDEDDFTELPPENGSLANKFRVRDHVNLRYGDKIIYRISHYVWSYEQIEQLMDSLKEKIDANKSSIDTFKQEYRAKMNTLEPNVNKALTDIHNLKNSTLNTETFIRKSDKISLTMLNDELKNKIFKSYMEYELIVDPSSPTYPLPFEKKESQVILVLLDAHVSIDQKLDNASYKTLLNKDVDYTILENNRIKLATSLVRNTRKLKFLVFNFGE